MSPNEHGNWCSSYSGGILLRQKAYPTQLFHHCTFTQTIMKGEPHTPPRVISWWSHEEPRCPHAIVAPLLRLDSIHGRLYHVVQNGIEWTINSTTYPHSMYTTLSSYEKRNIIPSQCWIYVFIYSWAKSDHMFLVSVIIFPWIMRNRSMSCKTSMPIISSIMWFIYEECLSYS